ncbi:carcinoembryonic antigen-related cell adhesion molecule 5-like [Notolabrus celidotus]|uniref:carcinoembryonic antigen-related cell adhesion molecule 5-like n=1 Tax=Notolabrus celidotus TaxID=1203425 RepID=UPI00148FBD11|nr:carcinoembryonic antigen-related cell adhesion molecule 5-like [Notolabrus celidotus]
MRRAAMGLKAAASVLVICLLSLPVVRGDITPDAPKTPTVSVNPSGEVMEGSSVTLTCSSDANPAATYTWYKVNDGQPPTKEAQLHFRSIQSSDSGEYYCEAENTLGKRQSQIISIKVKYAPKSCSVSVSPTGEIIEGSSVTLTCSCDGYPAPEYTWYKENDHGHHSKRSELVFSQIQSSDSGRYYCTAENDVGRERTSGYTDIDVKYAPKLRPVSVSPSGPIVEGRRVTLTCSSDANPAAVTYTWYKKNGNQGLQTDSTSTKYFMSIQASDSGEYYCTAVNRRGSKTSESVFIDVTYAPKSCSVSESPNGEITEGSSVTLTCSCDGYPAPEYSWYKEYDHGHHSKGSELVFSQIQSSDSGRYYCTAENDVGRERTSGYTKIDVKYAPKLPSVSVSHSGPIVEGSSVTLTCSSDANPAASYTWYKENRNTDLQLSKKGPRLYFSSIQASDSGEYYCTAVNRLGSKTSESVFIDVTYAPRLPSVNPSGEMKEGSPVTLTCSSDANPVATYTWYKVNDGQPPTKEAQLYFRSILSSDSGEYYCEAENTLGKRQSQLFIKVKYAPKSCSVSVSPNGEITEGSSVTLTCSCDGYPAPEYTWYKESGRGHQGKGSKLVFSHIQPSDSGRYDCAAKNDVGRTPRSSGYTNIDVKYAPKLRPVSVSPSGPIEEGMYVTLTCSSDANPAATYTWYKKNGNRGVQQLSKNTQLVFKYIQSSDSGEYYCEAKNKLSTRRSNYISIDVKYAPRLPSVIMSHSAEIVENSSVTLSCSSNANPAASYTWYKENGNTDLQLSNKGPKLVFSSIQASDLGQYYCTAVNKLGRRTSDHITVNVKYAPKLPSVSVSPPAEIVEGSSVTLTCSSDANPAANYTWYKKNGNTDPQLSKKGPKLQFSSIQASDFGQYYCTAENKLGRRTSDHITVNVKYAPKLPSVSVSPSAKIVEGSSVNLTCSSDANPAANYTWYKENEESQKTSGQIFTIGSSRPEHSGNYVCLAANVKGHHNSTLHLTVVAGPWKLKAAVTVPVIMIILILTFVIIWIIKKRTRKQQSEPRERPDNREQIQLAEQQNDLHYATVHFAKNPEEPVYSNIKLDKPKRNKKTKKEEEEEEGGMVEYSAVRFNTARTAQSGQETVEDPAALYSTVNKPTKEHGRRNL